MVIKERCKQHYKTQNFNCKAENLSVRHFYRISIRNSIGQLTKRVGSSEHLSEVLLPHVWQWPDIITCLERRSSLLPRIQVADLSQIFNLGYNLKNWDDNHYNIQLESSSKITLKSKRVWNRILNFNIIIHLLKFKGKSRKQKYFWTQHYI